MIISPRLLIIILVSLLIALGLFKLGMRGESKPSSLSAAFTLSPTATTYKSASPEIHILQGQGNQLLLQLDMRYYKKAKIELMPANQPISGWCVHVGDSPSNDGFGGDAGQFSHNAELQIHGENGGMLVFGSEVTDNNSMTKSEMIMGEPGLLKQNTPLTLTIADGLLQWDGGGKKKGEKRSPQLLELNGQMDIKHGRANDMQIFLALNRLIAAAQAAGSHCISTVKVTLTVE